MQKALHFSMVFVSVHVHLKNTETHHKKAIVFWKFIYIYIFAKCNLVLLLHHWLLRTPLTTEGKALCLIYSCNKSLIIKLVAAPQQAHTSSDISTRQQQNTSGSSTPQQQTTTKQQYQSILAMLFGNSSRLAVTTTLNLL